MRPRGILAGAEQKPAEAPAMLGGIERERIKPRAF